MRRLLNETTGRSFVQNSEQRSDANETSTHGHPYGREKDSMRDRDMLNYFIWGFIILLVIGLVIGGVYFFKPEWIPWSMTNASPVTKEQPSGKKSGYIAVFLTNNQVYFGKISGLNTQYPVLRDVYYLRTQRSLVPPDEAESSPGARLRVERQRGTVTTQQNERLTLLKLGNELHGPVDEIKLNREHIIYIEEIRDDSKVFQAIVKYQTQKE